MKIIKKEEIRANWKKINDQLKEAKRFISEEKVDEALYFVWLAAENLVNTLKVLINGFYLKGHKTKAYTLKDYFLIGILKKDYSETFEKLSRYRIPAEFHPYTSIPKDYTKENVERFMNDIEEFKKEIERKLIEKKII